jgi:hypothetical protein
VTKNGHAAIAPSAITAGTVIPSVASRNRTA